MILPTRWIKIFKDMWSNPSRSLIVIFSIAIGIASVGMITNAARIVQRDLYGQYSAGNPSRLSIYISGFPKELANSVAQNDLARATDIARSMVKQYGMSEKLGHMTFEQERKPLFLDIAPGSGTKEYSEETAREIDNEVKAIIEHSYTKVKDTLTKKRDLLELVARTLLEKESIDGEELRNMLKEHGEGDHGNESR